MKQISPHQRQILEMINQKGQAFIFGIVAIGVVMVSTLLTIAGAQLFYQNSGYSLEAEKATALAEAGIDKAVGSLNASAGSYNGEGLGTNGIPFGDGEFSVKITDKNSTTKIIEATGYLPNKPNSKVRRIIRIETSKGIGVSFKYGIQVGDGGMELGQGNTVTGSIYSNGSITAGTNNTITGDAWVAGGIQPNPDQESVCTGVNCENFVFGRNWSGNDQLDVAQSFQATSSGLLNKVSVRVKKSNVPGQPGPSNVDVRILRDNNGSPDKNGVLALGTLYTTLVTDSFGWIDVTFNTSPSITANTTYWLMIDTSSDPNNYWFWQNDKSQGYNKGVLKWSPNWSTGNPQWNSFIGDLEFKTYMGGVPTSIRGDIDFRVNGAVHANTIDKLIIGGDAYYQSISNSTVVGTSNPGSPDPAPEVFPISDANVDSWKLQVGGTPINFTSCYDGLILGPGKITGSVNIGSGCDVIIKSPLWITGNFAINSNNTLTLDSSYGTTSGVIVVDGRITLNTHNILAGTGQGNSLLMALSTFDSPANGYQVAIQIGNNGNTGVFYASKGIIEPGSSNSYKELTAWGIRLVNQSTINYQTGLSSTLFSSGPGGTFSLVKGTYQVK